MLKVGCQTYTWEMLGAGWKGSVDDILDGVAAAGYQGIEITNSMIREYARQPADFAKAIERRGLTLAAFAYASPAGLTDPAARTTELEDAKEAMGHGIRAKRSKSGAISFDLVEMEDDHASFQ